MLAYIEVGTAVVAFYQHPQLSEFRWAGQDTHTAAFIRQRSNQRNQNLERAPEKSLDVFFASNSFGRVKFWATSPRVNVPTINRIRLTFLQLQLLHIQNQLLSFTLHPLIIRARLNRLRPSTTSLHSFYRTYRTFIDQ